MPPVQIESSAHAADVDCVAEKRDLTVKTMLKKLWADDRGGEVLEYALIAGLIVVAAIAIIGSVGGKVVAKWTSLDGSM